MNLDEINEKLDRLEEKMYLSRRPIHYVDHYDRYQPDYQDATMEATQSNQQGQGWYQNNFGDQWYDHEQMSNQNRGYTSWNNQGPSYDSYDPQNNYAPQEYNNYASQQQFDNFQQWEDNSDEFSQDDEIMNMFKQLLEGQENEKKEISEFKARFEGLETHVKELENQIAQVASSSRNNEEGVLPGKSEANPKEYCQVITLSSGKELLSGDIAKGKTEKPEEDELSVAQEADNEVSAEEDVSEKKKGRQAQETPKTEEKTEHLPPYGSKVLKEEDSQQKVLKVKQDEYGLLDDACVGYEKMMDSHKTHDGEASSLELKKEPHTVETERGTEEEASNGKTSMESKGEAEKPDDWSKLKTPNTEMKPLPQELWYDFLGSNFTYHVIMNDALSETETKTFLAELISDSRWVPLVNVVPKKGE